MPKPEVKQFMIEDAQIIFRNFEGKEGPYNHKGDRNFSVIIPDEKMAQKMLRDGWNVKYLKPQEEGEPATPYVQVSVNFANRPPRVVMISSVARTTLGEDSVDVLDWADIKTADLICNGYDWEVNDKTGTKAYLKSLYVTVEEDELERKYAQMED